jgi:hypothetical protein
MRTRTTALALGLLTALATARPLAAVTIADLVHDPDAYNGRSVTVTGVVERALPVYEQSGYELRDGALKLTVVSRTGPPTVGASLTVTGVAHVFHEGDGGPEENHFPPYLNEVSRAAAP